MFLEDAVAKYNKGQDFYIGGAEGFFFIGTKETFEKDIDRISDKFRTSIHECLIRNRSYAKRYRSQGNKVGALRMDALIAREKEQLERFTPLRHMSVSRVYEKDPKAAMPGTVILIDATIRGRYWFKSEYEEAMGR